MEMVKLTIDGVQIEVPKGTTVLEAARSAHIHIPTLCYLKGINEIGACRMCLVEVKGARSLQASCVFPVGEGMEIRTNTPAIREARKTNMELILSNHDRKCLTCVRSENCELQTLSTQLGIDDIRYEGEQGNYAVDELSTSIVRDPNKCILCRRCVSTCREVQGIGAIGATERGFNTIIEPVYSKSLADVNCINCGQCIEACPVGALREKDDTDKVWDAINNPDLHVVVQTAPAVRVALGEEFGMPIGTRVTGKMVAALRRLGFDRIFDTDFTADLTIMEEGTELLGRLKKGENLPLITSCSPGWIKYCEHNYPELLDNLSTCKSPHEMMGAMVKSYYAEKTNQDPANIYVVSIMPCTAKKFESQRPELQATGYPDVDAVLTTRELARMIKQAGINFLKLEDEDFDPILGDSTGAAVIFGATGGVMEAALRTVAEIVTGKPLENLEIHAVRGLEGVKEVEIPLGDITVKAAVAHGTGNAKALMDKVVSGEKEYHFIEIMGCPGGCVTGGGQPIVPAQVQMDVDVRAKRAAAIYDEDRSLPVRKSHENESVKKVYDEYLGEPNSHRAHELLHTHYTPRNKF
ncbi:MAG: NADH-dependent [FeFe] hydrogenase, group A6 [Clostridia bacterium]|nr:NADH-dependent [FeFe] hydrogenase, group A6 [Clostridia bacterium]MDD4679324.1 NADH-dependent [FeFe] hydrogenase, group A6 [Clostridia bacterium]